jgi:hypothetical protein
MEYASVSPENQDLAKLLTIGSARSPHTRTRRWPRSRKQAPRSTRSVAGALGGIRSFPDWLSGKTGFDMHTGAELLRVGQAMSLVPKIAKAFEAGQLSFDKVRQITTVATPATDEFLLEIAQGASGAQLARICRSLRRIAEADAPEEANEHLSRRGIWMHWDEHGMLELVARLTSEDAAVVQAALESITGSRPVAEPADDGVKDPADDRWAARRVDALVAMCEHVVAGGAENLVTSTASRQIVVHIDVGVLTGEANGGRCFVEGGSPLAAGAARRIGCDAEVIGVIERNGLPIDVGRKQRMLPDRLRLALHVRDRFCRFPGCGVPAYRTEAHHHEHWALGGETNLGNLLLLCGFHHRRHHSGAYRIRKTAEGFCFETDDGHVIQPPPRDPVTLARNPGIGRQRPCGPAQQCSSAMR